MTATRDSCAFSSAAAVLAMLAVLLAAVPAASTSADSPRRPQHVFIIVLENESFNAAFGRDSPAPYLSRELASKGELLRHYYAIGHYSLDNYIAIVSGQAPNPYTLNDCFTYYDFRPLTGHLNGDGQALGAGCVYPRWVPTIAGQLEEKHLTWRAYMDDMKTPCLHPALGQPDNHIRANSETQYATRHNPFVYFHSIIDDPSSCAQHVVPLTRLAGDLKSVATTPNLVFIAPDLCHDGHDGESRLCPGGGLVAVDHFLPSVVGPILASPAFKRDGILIITFDEAFNAKACCNEPTGPNTVAPGRSGPGGGRTGALIISPFVRPGSVNDHPYNHYALLRSVEDLFGLKHLGFADQPGLRSFGSDVYNRQ